MKEQNVTIIGSGLGGLLCGYILAKEGYGVTILEKNKTPGGALQSFQIKGSTFDTGVHYMGGLAPGQNLYKYFTYFGLMKDLPLERLHENQFDLISLEDKTFPLAQGFENFKEQLLHYFPSEADALSNYISTLQEVGDSFPLFNLSTRSAHNELIYQSASAKAFFQSLSKQDGSLLAEVLTGNQFLYGGLTPNLPLHIPALINNLFISSAWKVVGGSQQIADILIHHIQAMGGRVVTSKKGIGIQKVGDRFIVDTEDGEQFLSSQIIAGIHPTNIFQMVQPELFRKAYRSRIENLSNTTSSFALYIILKSRSFPYLNYNLYHHSNQKNDPGSNQKWPSHFLLMTPEKDETGYFAKNMSVLTTMNGLPWIEWESSITGSRSEAYLDKKQEFAQQLLHLVAQKFPGIQQHIEYMEISTPLTWRDYTGTPEGSMYGVQKDFNHPLETRIAPRTKLPGFFFTGQNVNLHGVMGVTAGAVMTCGEMIGLDYLVNKINHG